MIQRRTIKKFTDEVARRFKPIKIILFGSYAYGRPTEDSDVDLLVILPGKGRPQDKSLRIRQEVEVDFPIDLIVRTPSEVHRRLLWGDSFLQEEIGIVVLLYEAARA